MAYRAMMLTGVPNFAFTIGYTNASWTLKADLVAEYVVRLLAHLDAHGLRAASCRCGTRRSASAVHGLPGRLRAAGRSTPCPRRGTVEPWTLQAELLPRRTILRGADRRRGAPFR